MGFEPAFSMAAAATRPVGLRARIRRCRLSYRLSAANTNAKEESQMRSIGLDIHRDFMEVAIAEGSEIRSLPRVEMSCESLELFAQSLGTDDQVALEVSG